MRRLGRTVISLAGAALLTLAAQSVVPASAHPLHDGRSNQVIDGNARFEVLTPTLIRLEYAGDGKFVDATTFNVLNRHLPVPAFTTSVVDGYRVISTADLLLRYKRGSGPFTSANTSIQLRVDGHTVTAKPDFPSTGNCAFSTLCEAENARLAGGAAIANDHTGYTGTGFVAGFEQTGASITEKISGVPAAGTYALTLRYANSRGSDGQVTTRTLNTSVNGAAGPELSFAPTSDWNTWATTTVAVPLAAGTNTITISEDANNSGKVNVDSFAVTPAGAS